MNKCKLLGLVTLYYPDIKSAADNIQQYLVDVDRLIVWDNSPSHLQVQQQLMAILDEEREKIIWHTSNRNMYIAPAINYAWKYGVQHEYDLLLIMDQDSRWDNFSLFFKEVEALSSSHQEWIYTPYIVGLDEWKKNSSLQQRRIFINSGTIVPITILNAIDGVDETFPLDALDHDTALRCLKRGFKVVSLTSHIMHHTMGHPKRSGILRILTPDYPSDRLYSIVRSHIINYRKNHQWMTSYEKKRFFNEFIFWTFIRIILVEKPKKERFKMYWKGIKEGLNFNINLTKQ